MDALIKAKTKGTDIVVETFEKLKDLAKNTSCEDLLNPTVSRNEIENTYN